jgi:hypothetical protein
MKPLETRMGVMENVDKKEKKYEEKGKCWGSM